MGQEDRIKEYVDFYTERLELVQRMWTDPYVQCYNDQKMPIMSLDEMGARSVFLAGPTSRRFYLNFNWRCFAVKYLREAGFKGWIYVPEPRGMEHDGDFTERGYIHQWESTRLITAIHKVFWIPREGTEMLGLNTNHELGFILGIDYAREERPLSLFIGWPLEAERMGLPNHYANHRFGRTIYSDLKQMCEAVAAA